MPSVGRTARRSVSSGDGGGSGGKQCARGALVVAVGTVCELQHADGRTIALQACANQRSAFPRGQPRASRLPLTWVPRKHWGLPIPATP